MAIPSILTMIKNRLPYLNDGALDTVISEFVIEIQYRLQSYLGIDTADVEIESAYTPLQRSLIADVVCCFLILRRVVENLEGNATAGGTNNGGKYLKRAKAGEVESEFALPTNNDITKFGLNTATILGGFKNNACQVAIQLGFSLCVCDDCSLVLGYLNEGPSKTFIVHVP